MSSLFTDSELPRYADEMKTNMGLLCIWSAYFGFCRQMPGFSLSVPFSCCSVNSRRPCIHTNMRRTYGRYQYDPDVELTIYTKGCGVKIAETICFPWLVISYVAAALFGTQVGRKLSLLL